MKNKMAKKVMALAVSCAMLFSLAGCGSSGEEPPAENTAQAENPGSESDAEKNEDSGGNGEKTKLIGMCWGSTETYTRLSDAILEQNPELGEKYEVEWVLGGEGDGDVAEKIRLALSANEYIADITVLNYTQVPEFAEAGVLNDVSAAIAPYESELTEAALNLTKYKDSTIAVPFEVKSKVWYYRQDIFDECGVDVSTVKNTDDFIAAGKKIQEKYPGSYMWNLGQTAAAYAYYMTLSGNGASFCDADGNYNISQDAGVRTMLEDYKKMVDAGIIMDVSDWTTDWESALADGSLVSQLGAGWLGQDSFLPTYAAGQEGKWSCTTWPEIGGTVAGSDAGGSVMVVPTFAKNPEAAAEFISYMCLSEQGSISCYDITACLPINTKAQENELLKNKVENGFFGMSIIEAQLEALNDLAVFNYTPKAASEQDIVTEYFTKAVYGQESIDDALKDCENDLSTMLGNAYQ